MKMNLWYIWSNSPVLMDAVDDDDVDCAPVDSESDGWYRSLCNPGTFDLEGIGLSVDVLSRVREPVELDPISIKPVRTRNEK